MLTIIFSSFRKSKSFDENMQTHKELLTIPNAVEVDGFFEGEAEKSVKIEVNGFNDLRAIQDLAFNMHNQDSILLINKKYAQIVDRHENVLHFGLWEEVTKEEAEKSVGYSIINGKYFIIK